jgi:hypothetical protein
MSLRANRGLQPNHHAVLRMVLAPRFQVRDVFLVQKEIHKCSTGLVAEPAAHPRRKVTRHCRRHSQILAAFNRTHINGDLCICSRRKKRDCKRCTYQSKFHFARPFAAQAMCPRMRQMTHRPSISAPCTWGTSKTSLFIQALYTLAFPLGTAFSLSRRSQARGCLRASAHGEKVTLTLHAQ